MHRVGPLERGPPAETLVRTSHALDRALDAVDRARDSASEGGEDADDSEGDDAEHDCVLRHRLTLLPAAQKPEVRLQEHRFTSSRGCTAAEHVPRLIARARASCIPR